MQRHFLNKIYFKNHTYYHQKLNQIIAEHAATAIIRFGLDKTKITFNYTAFPILDNYYSKGLYNLAKYYKHMEAAISLALKSAYNHQGENDSEMKILIKMKTKIPERNQKNKKRSVCAAISIARIRSTNVSS